MVEEKKGIVTRFFEKIGLADVLKDRVKFIALLLTFLIFSGMLIFKGTSIKEVLGNGEFTSKIQEANESEFKKINAKLDSQYKEFTELKNSHYKEFTELKEILTNGYKRDD